MTDFIIAPVGNSQYLVLRVITVSYTIAGGGQAGGSNVDLVANWNQVISTWASFEDGIAIVNATDGLFNCDAQVNGANISGYIGRSIAAAGASAARTVQIFILGVKPL